MGTQFWWFYDVLVLSVGCGILYSAVIRGFNKVIFRLIGSVLAMAIGIPLSVPLANWMYNAVYVEKIQTSLSNTYASMDFYEFALQTLEEQAPEGTDKAVLEIQLKNNSTEEWFVITLANTLQSMVNEAINPQVLDSYTDYLLETPTTLEGICTAILQDDGETLAVIIEESYVRTYYVEMVRMVAFLLLVLVVAILMGILTKMTGNLEDVMHIRKGDHALAVPVGLIETLGALLVILVIVRLLVMATNGEMLVFNEDTIESTKLFHLLYERI